MTKDLLMSRLLKYLIKYTSLLSNEDKILINILSKHLLTLILPDRKQDISEQLPEIISDAIEAFISSEDTNLITYRDVSEKLLGRKISNTKDNKKIILLVKEIMESEALTV